MTKESKQRAVVRAFVLAAAAVAAVTFVPAALASHSFTDVPDSNPFHAEISIFKATNITTGCTATTFCPDAYVKRQAMAAFIDRALGLLVRPGETTQKGIPGSRVEMIDDDVSFVGTRGNALRLEGPSGNIVGGSATNIVTTGVTAAAIGGGLFNKVTDQNGVVAGGYQNIAGDNADTTTSANQTTVGGGYSNIANADSATVAGGGVNSATAGLAAVGGGQLNVASGFAATIPGGLENAAGGGYSLAAGRRAKAIHQGAFVWADSTDADFSSTFGNQFAVRAAGGAKFVSGASNWISTNAALLAQHSNNGVAGWFHSALSTSTAAVIKATKHPSSTGNFFECRNVDPDVPKCHINAAGTFVSGSDFAEALPARAGKAMLEPGDVLVASSKRVGSVEKARSRYNRAVLGVYSTRPGVLGADKGGITKVGAEDVPVAITGIVPVKASAENGAIRVGDLLTTARTPGHAMRAGYDPPQGTVVGKALAPLASGRAVIRLLVMPR